MGNADFDSGSFRQISSSDDKKEHAELKRSLSSETKKRSAIEKNDLTGQSGKNEESPVGSGKERAWAKWRKENTDI